MRGHLPSLKVRVCAAIASLAVVWGGVAGAASASAATVATIDEPSPRGASFLTVWDTSKPGQTGNQQIRLPLVSSGTYDFTVAWGDGTTSHVTRYDETLETQTHTYDTPGQYTVTITGAIEGWSFGWSSSDARKLMEIAAWGPLQLGNMGGYFRGAQSLRITATDTPDLTGTTNLAEMFLNAQAFNGDVSNWDVSNVTNMSAMFFNAAAFNADLSNWDVTQVTDMSAMFNGAAAFDSDLSNWDVSNVTDMSYMFSMFSGAAAFDGDLSGWDTSNVTDMRGMFSGAAFNGDLSGWDTSNVTDMSYMFSGAAFNGDLSGWDTSNVTDMSYTFSGAAFNGDLSGWDTSNVTNMSWMFGCEGTERTCSFNRDLSAWDVSKVTDMSRMFFNAAAFNGDLSGWNAGNVTDMRGMFSGAAAFNGDLSGWDTGNVTDMGAMFSGAAAFNSDVSGWDVSNVTDMSLMFSGAAAFNGDVSGWDVSQVSNMSRMFAGAAAFNSDISGWDVRNVTDMSRMFHSAAAFNSDLSGWNTSDVTDMRGMFSDTAAFNSDLGNWDVSNLISLESMFSGATSFNGDIRNWDVSNIYEMSGMFSGATAFNGDISGWHVSNVHLMNSMFSGATSFNTDISGWDTSNVTNLDGMFSGAAAFNGDISKWDVGNVTSMALMFKGAAAFNGDLSNWDTRNVTNTREMFSGAAAFNGDLSNWDTSNITFMAWMFLGAEAFNGDVSGWDTRNVIHMREMFSGAVAFNGDLSKWDVGNVTDMSWMFSGAAAFNGDISGWKTSNVAYMRGMFSGAAAFDGDLSGWDVSNVTDMSGMFSNVRLSPWHYDALLLGWSSRPVRYGVDFSGGLSQYTPAAVEARRSLIEGHGWQIYDGGLTTAPYLRSVSPDHGRPGGGTTVTIEGGGFDPQAVARIGDSDCLVVETTATSLTCTTTSHPPGTVDVTVTNPDSQSGSLRDAFTYGEPPGAPTDASAAAGDRQAVVSWTAPQETGGVPITGYTVRSAPGGRTCTSAGDETSCTVTGLTNGVSYSFTVVAANRVGTSEPSAPSDPVIPVGVPAAPTAVTAVAGNQAAAVSWTAPGNTGGVPITGYTVTSAPGARTCTSGGDGTSCTVGELSNGVSYQFTVVATNRVGTSEPSAASDPVIPASAPAPPTAVTAVAGNQAAAVSWTAPTNTGGAPITGYTVTSAPGGRTCTSGGTSCTVTGLTNGLSYRFTVVAANRVGSSAPSAASDPVVPVGVPGPPTAVTATAGNQAAVVSWTAPGNTGGAPINGFTVTSAPGGRTCTSGGTSCTVTGLTNGVSYRFTVTAANRVGSSAPSAASAPVTPVAPTPPVPPVTVPGAPTGVTATAGNGSAAVSWQAPGSTGGAAITGYTVTAAPGGRTCTIRSTSCTVTGLTNGVSYRFTVTAANRVGISAPSAASAPVSPTAPRQAQAVKGRVVTTAKAKTKAITLPRLTTARKVIRWTSRSPRLGRVKNGRLVLTHRKGRCVLTATAAGDARYLPLSRTYTVRIK